MHDNEWWELPRHRRLHLALSTEEMIVDKLESELAEVVPSEFLPSCMIMTGALFGVLDLPTWVLSASHWWQGTSALRFGFVCYHGSSRCFSALRFHYSDLEPFFRLVGGRITHQILHHFMVVGVHNQHVLWAVNCRSPSIKFPWLLIYHTSYQT